ncbi:diaminopimelate epimerase [Bacillus horti]|uniref:Diaminopimelate epimerase n=1 Tax=Caldalkalibacillus horti TaxID=77523 RepID=A0ABT9VTT6_9BACI|nr:diaminopimelate epimerase [Bacillus horti]MDQ0164398.1 diaminopimelate epimerase [Bacillus horti]
MNIRFTKMHALGNNYIYVNQIEENIPEEFMKPLAIAVSNVQTGIGSDGLILICDSNHAAIRMRVFNSDGSEAKNCGNGLRCVARYAYEKGLVQNTSFTIETLGGIVTAHVQVLGDTVNSISIDMGEPRLRKGEIPMLDSGSAEDLATHSVIELEGQVYSFTGVSMGNPHAVFFVEDVKSAPVDTLGPQIEKHPMFPEGTNVEFVSPVSNNELDFRVWERGSGITYACGTGACAAVVAAILHGKFEKGKAVTVHLLGGDLEILWGQDDHVWMTGPAEYICHGEYAFEK